MSNMGVIQYARFFQAQTISGMAQKLGLTWPPAPAISVRNLIKLAGDMVAKRSDVVKAPWAVLLCKFKDDLSEPFPRSFYENLFTISGAGTMNMTDCFRDASQGKLDVTGSVVFPPNGWYVLDKKRSDYKAGMRNDLINWAKQKATENNPKLLDPYPVIVIQMNVPTDLFGQVGAAVGDAGIWEPPNGNGQCSLSPGIIGQEIGHGYGLDHSRVNGSNEDYKDPWDLMSTLAADMAPSPTLTQVDAKGRTMFWIGPMLNAANMNGRGWLNSLRVWNAAVPVRETITLRPLARPDLPGWIAARIPTGFNDFLVEFRVAEGWDANIPRPAVLVHYFLDNQSYIVSGSSGNLDLVAGDTFNFSDLGGGSPSTVKVEVVEIDPASYTATVRISADS